MILVSVGTHHQPFDRLVAAAAALAGQGEEVVVQRGCSTVSPVGCTVVDQVDPQRLERWMEEARVVVLHGGTSSFLQARALGRVPVVVPRRARFGEHVDDHQVEFAASIAPGEAVVAEPEDLAALLARWTEERAPHRPPTAFADRLGALVDGLVRARRERS
ncbi:MAG: multidrug MFS transporter [Alphaproteobacteria bacterium]|nr:multidrug MFS transporter [Alphaproteobacteria bacterium]MCB9696557.1 multidrug MFS transporter [Alphaproteobacteria bacterium]